MPISLSTRWFQQGPYPAGMREQPFGPDPRFLAECGSAYSATDPASKPIDPDSVRVHGDRGNDAATHVVSIAYEDIDWDGPRSTAGWAALQWQALAWTSLDVDNKDGLVVAVNLSGAAEFAIVERSQDQPKPFQWYRGDFYSYAMGPNGPPSDARYAPVPHLIHLDQGSYYFLVKALYEVRVFGAPSQGPPTVTFTLQVAACDSDWPSMVLCKPLCVYPDVVQGRFASLDSKDDDGLITVGIRNPSSRESFCVREVYCSTPGFWADLCTEDLVLPPQTTSQILINVRADDLIPEESSALQFEVCLTRDAFCSLYGCPRLYFDLPLNHVDADSPFAVTYTVGVHTQLAVVKPPRNVSSGAAHHRHIILALHGAGVDVQDPFWVSAIPRQRDAWVLMPTGLTPWGLDWQQTSCAAWKDLVDCWIGRYCPDEAEASRCKVFIIGHSNGGQGAWYAMTHLRDRFIGGVVGAGYIKLEEYVGFQWRDMRHTADASLVGILDSALSVFCNDLHASNLVGMPLLVKYGAADDNVPPWHSRAMKNLLCHWNAMSGVPRERWPRLIEVPGEGHWWDGFLQEEDVQGMLDEAFEHSEAASPPNKFTVTSVIPQETEAVFGWRITQTAIPGRVARLAVEYVEQARGLSVRIATRNVQTFCLEHSAALLQQRCPQFTSMTIDGSEVALCELGSGSSRPTTSTKMTWFVRQGRGWKLELVSPNPRRPLWPISLFLSGTNSIALVVPKLPVYASVARRWSQDLLLYNAITTDIISEDEAIERQLHTCWTRTCVVMGGPFENRYAKALHRLAEERRSRKPFIQHLSAQQFKIRDRVFADPGTALLYTIESPNRHDPDQHRYEGDDWSQNLVLTGTDVEGIERAGRLLPVRTGTPIPEWIVVGPEADRFGGGGVLAAGWYDNDWCYSEAMSYLAD